MSLAIVKDRIQREKALDDIPRQPAKGRDLVSTNSKTGISLNFPVSATCRPTKICAKICYACRPQSRLMMTPALRKAWTTYYFFEDNDLKTIAERLNKEYTKYQKRLGLKALRWNGVGDLFPKAVDVLNYMAPRYDIVHMVFSRRPDMVNTVDVHPNLAVNFSLDESNWSKWVLITRPQTNFTYLRTSDFVPDAPIDVVFRQHIGWKDISAHKADCPADDHSIDHALACVKCNRCAIPNTDMEPANGAQLNSGKLQRTDNK